MQKLQGAAFIIGSNNTSVNEKIDAFDDILNYVDDIDTAIDFCKIGGASVLLTSLESLHAEICSKSADVIAEIAQNNPFCQKTLIEMGVLPKLLNLLNLVETLPTSLRAISSVVRNNESSFQEFIKIGGLKSLLGCFRKSTDEKVITRAAFFLNSMCTDFNEIFADLDKVKAIEIVIPLVHPHAEYNATLENLLSLLCSLVEKTDSYIPMYATFKGSLLLIMKLANDKSECTETIEYCQKLLNLIEQQEMSHPNNKTTSKISS